MNWKKIKKKYPKAWSILISSRRKLDLPIQTYLYNRHVLRIEEDECYCKLCSALTKKDHEIQLYKGRLANFCRDCWNQLLTKSIPEIRELLRKRND